MTTPMKLAKQAATKCYRVERRKDHWLLTIFSEDHDHRHETLFQASYNTQEGVDREVGRYKTLLTNVIKAAIDQAIMQCPIPSALSYEKLSQIIERSLKDNTILRVWRLSYQDNQTIKEIVNDRRQLIDEVLFCHRLMNDEAKGLKEAYDNGKRDAYREVLELLIVEDNLPSKSTTHVIKEVKERLMGLMAEMSEER